MRGYAAIGLYGTKCNANLDGALRAASCFGASIVLLQVPRYKPGPADTYKTYKHKPVIVVEDLLLASPFGCSTVAVEITEGASSLLDFTHPERALYVFGPEDGAIPDTILSRCQFVVSIPTVRCMNLAATVNVVLYDRMLKRRDAYHPRLI